MMGERQPRRRRQAQPPRWRGESLSRRAPLSLRQAPSGSRRTEALQSLPPAAPATVKSTPPAAPPAGVTGAVHPWTAQSGAVTPAGAGPWSSLPRPCPSKLVPPEGRRARDIHAQRRGPTHAAARCAARRAGAAASRRRDRSGAAALPPAIEAAGEMARLRVERDEAKRQLESAQQQLALYAKGAPSSSNGYGALFDRARTRTPRGPSRLGLG